jgi:hypothetical protein
MLCVERRPERTGVDLADALLPLALNGSDYRSGLTR